MRVQIKEATFPSSISVGEDSDESDIDNDLVLCDESVNEFKVNQMMTVIL